MKRRKTLAISACAAVTAALTLAACSSSTSTPGAAASGGSTGSSGAAAYNAANTGIVNPSDKKGGTITFAESSVPDSLDPGNTYYAWTWNFTRLYATPLTTYESAPGSAGNTVVPGIATSLGTVSDNGLVWTYHIKPGLKFSDGEPITSEDVKYAVERTYDKSVLENGPTYFQNLLADPSYPGPYKDPKGNLTSVTTPNSTTIQFHLVAPFPDFNYVAAIPQTAPVPPDKDTGANYQLNVVSSGPYMFQSYTLNKEAVLVDNPYWTPNEDPQAKQLASKITITFNVNEDDIDNRQLAGDLDIEAQALGVGAAARAKVLSNPSLEKNADDASGNRLWFIYLNTKVAPLTNLYCRQAIEYAADKTELQTAFGGPVAGGAIATTVLLPGQAGYSPIDDYKALSEPGGDDADAKAALAKCGQPNGFTVGAAYRSDRPAETQAAQALQAALAKVGITLQLHGYPSGSYYSDFAGAPNYVHSHDLGVDFGGWSPDWPDGYGMLDELVNGDTIQPAGNTNISEENNPQVNALFKAASGATTTQAEATADYAEIDKLVMADAVILPEVYAKDLLYRNPNLTNVYVEAPFGEYNYAVLGTDS